MRAKSRPIDRNALIDQRRPGSNRYLSEQQYKFPFEAFQIKNPNSIPATLYVQGNYKLEVEDLILSPGVYANTTANASNMYIDSAGIMYRSTCRRDTKKDIEELSLEEAKGILNSNPVTFKSISLLDDPDKVHSGFIIEELLEINEKLVLLDYLPTDYKYDTIKEQKVLKEGSVKVPVGKDQTAILSFAVKVLIDINRRLERLEDEIFQD